MHFALGNIVFEFRYRQNGKESSNKISTTAIHRHTNPFANFPFAKFQKLKSFIENRERRVFLRSRIMHTYGMPDIILSGRRKTTHPLPTSRAFLATIRPKNPIGDEQDPRRRSLLPELPARMARSHRQRFMKSVIRTHVHRNSAR